MSEFNLARINNIRKLKTFMSSFINISRIVYLIQTLSHQMCFHQKQISCKVHLCIVHFNSTFSSQIKLTIRICPTKFQDKINAYGLDSYDYLIHQSPPKNVQKKMRRRRYKQGDITATMICNLELLSRRKSTILVFRN